MKLKKTYYFALISAGFISLLAALLLVFFMLIYGHSRDLVLVIPFTFILFFAAFFLIQYRVEHFIYQRIKKIFQSVTDWDISQLPDSFNTSDLDKMSEEVRKYALNKRNEIDHLNEQAVFRREYMGNVAHELKTPLFAIQSYLLTLIDGGGLDKKIKKKYLKRAEKNVDRLVNIVEDLDFISKMDAHEIQLSKTRFDIVSLIRSSLDLLEMDATKYGVSIQLFQDYAPVWVSADEKRIEQVLINLISNSIKYAKKGGTCVIKVKENQDRFRICVIDEGEGIAPEHIPRLFERFYRVDSSRSRSEGGSGLGLSIVKHILEAHHQQITVTSEPGKGARFCFTLAKA